MCSYGSIDSFILLVLYTYLLSFLSVAVLSKRLMKFTYMAIMVSNYVAKWPGKRSITAFCFGLQSLLADCISPN